LASEVPELESLGGIRDLSLPSRYTFLHTLLRVKKTAVSYKEGLSETPARKNKMKLKTKTKSSFVEFKKDNNELLEISPELCNWISCFMFSFALEDACLGELAVALSHYRIQENDFELPLIPISMKVALTLDLSQRHLRFLIELW